MKNLILKLLRSKNIKYNIKYLKKRAVAILEIKLLKFYNQNINFDYRILVYITKKHI